MIALGEKLTHFEAGTKGYLEVGGSILAVGGIVLDTYYSAAKSIREIKPYSSVKAIKDGADIVRGGFKLGAGVFGAGTGLCSALLDLMKATDGKERSLTWLYGVRAATGFASAAPTAIAAFSYCNPLLMRVAKGYAAHSTRYRLLTSAAAVAGRLAARVRLLVWVARFNWIGLGLTAVEIGYVFIKDDELQDWCEKSVFRKEKVQRSWLGVQSASARFDGAAKELESLERAVQSVLAR